MNQSTKSLHPLHQIAMTPTHKLLLNQWLKEQALIFNRIALKESQIDNIRNELTNLYCFFFMFHSISLILLFKNTSLTGESCNRSWIPLICSLLCSLGLIWAVRYKIDCESNLVKLMDREEEDGRLLGKCVEELKNKGLEFDLLKEVDALRRAKSLGGEVNGVKKWSTKDFVTMLLVIVCCCVLGVTRVILCD